MKKLFIWTSIVTSLVLSSACGNFTSERALEARTDSVTSDKNRFDQVQVRKSEWDYENAPEQMGLQQNDYVVHFPSLPEEGSLKVRPWGGWYWPTYVGGISYRWNHASEFDDDRVYYDLLAWDDVKNVDIATLSPAEKYDIYLGNKDWRLTRRERERTDIMAARQGKEIPFWEGLCDLWAEATLKYLNPAPVTRTGPSGISVPFGSADIQALLAYNLQLNEGITYFASRRCDVDESELLAKVKRGEMSKAEYDEIMESAECVGINPGAFHVILSNLIALREEGFVADVTRDLQVWNQPVHGYRSHVVKERREGLSPTAAPGTVREVLVKTTMIYTVEITTMWDRTEVDFSESKQNYKYWLELNANDEIIGGSWVSRKRPDFLWKRGGESFSGLFAPLKDIYEESVRDLQKPVLSAQQDEFTTLRWSFAKGYFRHNITLHGKAPAKVAKVQLKTFSVSGREESSKDISLDEKHEFKVQLGFWSWFSGKIALIGLDEDGKILAKEEHSVL